MIRRAMAIDDALVWALLIACCAAGAVAGVMFESRRPSKTDSPRRSAQAARYLNAAVVGVGAGMGLTFAVLALAAVFARLG